MSVWFVTGASKGFGAHIVREALARGHQAVATARNPQTVHDAFPDAGDALLVAPLDVTDQEQARSAAEAAVERFGRIDVLVNNAGRGLLGAVEEAGDEEVRAVFDTNVFGLLAVTRAVLPIMRRQRSGRVFNLSSVGGIAVGQGWGIYGGTKYAVEGISEAMRRELAPLGVQVTIVEPGTFRTDFLDGSSLHIARTVIDDYADTAGQVRESTDSRNHQQVGDPAKAATVIVDVAEAPEQPVRLQLGADCVERVEARLDAIRTELDTWREVALSTAFEPSR
ncbi:oxidoreductase [Pseudonocardia xinjiangensis]|uniref:SDR family NAD(P)-dependent oxidoreductase n=1 Tax=Pseudonocardia xinjiangensis TaxID=75289 RepID=A0ABX1R6L7_9PSEU|nr:oxidoreductase [Pseudonocardia xinjiangensis]NMH76002.1 SDR family NAD(P)-dependent oxidoreductase [Pseudonocardia xinjiangensis]